MTQDITLENFSLDTAIPLPPCKGWPRAAVHHFDRQQALAILAALEINRPLLVRGEPGCGKTQLARAAAQVLRMPLASLVVNERTETEDLFWRYDALRRLSDANDPKRGVLNEKDYLSAGPLWWALDHDSAKPYTGRCSCEPDMGEGKHTRSYKNRVLLLIDEIDKADRAVPNSLLEALGNYSFDVPYINQRVECTEMTKAPLIIITTNNEQELPWAFVRRCLVLDIELDEETFVDTLAKRGKALFTEQFAAEKFDTETVFTEVAQTLLEKRQELQQIGESWLPGQAEYLDHLQAILALRKYQPDLDQQTVIDEMARFTYYKHRL